MNNCEYELSFKYLETKIKKINVKSSLYFRR